MSALPPQAKKLQWKQGRIVAEVPAPQALLV